MELYPGADLIPENTTEDLQILSIIRKDARHKQGGFHTTGSLPGEWGSLLRKTPLGQEGQGGSQEKKTRSRHVE